MNKKVFIFSFAIAVCLTVSSVGAYSSPSLVSIQYVDSGTRLFDNKDFDRAIIEFNKALLADPQNEDALRYLRLLGFGRGRCPSFAANCPHREQSCGVTGSCKDMRTAEQTNKGSKAGTSQQGKTVAAKTSPKLSKAEKAAVEKLHLKAVQKEKAALKELRAESAKEEEQFFKKVKAEQKAAKSPKGPKKDKKKAEQTASKTAAEKNLAGSAESANTADVDMGVNMSAKAGDVISSAASKTKIKTSAAKISDDEAARSLGEIVVRKDAQGTESSDEECCQDKISSDKEMSYEDCVANCQKLKKQAKDAAREKLKKKQNAKPPMGTMKAGMTMKKSSVAKSMVSAPSEESGQAMSVTGESKSRVMQASPAEEDTGTLARKLEPNLTKQQKYQLAKIRARNAAKEREVLRKMNADITEQEQEMQAQAGHSRQPAAAGKTSENDFLVDKLGAEAASIDENPQGSRVQVAADRESISPADESFAAKNAELREKMNEVLAMSKHDQDIIEKLQGKTKNNDEEVVRLRNDLAQTRASLETRRALLKDQTEKLRSLQDRLGALEMELHSRQYDFKDKQLDYDKKIADLEGEFGNYKSAKAKNEGEFKDHLKTLKDALAQKIAELDAAQEKLLFTEYKLKKRETQSVAKNNQFDEVKKTLSDLEDRLSGLQGSMQDGDMDGATLNPEKFPPPQTQKEAVYQRWIQRHDRLIAKLKEKLLWAREQMDFLGEYDIKLSDQKMAVLKEQLAEVKRQLHEKDGFPGGRNEDHVLMEGRLKDAQERLEMVEKILKEKDEQIQELEKQLNGALSTAE